MNFFVTAVLILSIACRVCSYEETNLEQNEQEVDLLDILSGGKAIRNQFPYQVALQRFIGEHFYTVCSGAIISLKWVVTTAFCVNNHGSFRIVAGSLIKDESHPDVQISQVKAVFVHPQFKGGISDYDIALLSLNTGLQFTKAVQPISLYDSEENIWGYSMVSSWNVADHSKEFLNDQLYYAIVFILKEKDCKRLLQSNDTYLNTVLCTRKLEESLYCPAESGSPLVIDGQLIGLLSWSRGTCDTAVYTNTVVFADFIFEYLKQ